MGSIYVEKFFTRFGLFIVSYSIFWTAFYLYFRNQAKKLNAELNGVFNMDIVKAAPS